MNLKNIKQYKSFNQKIREFFLRYDGTVLSIQESTRDNFERFPPPGNGILHCFTIHVVFHNTGIFGKSGDFLYEVFPRFTFLHSQLADYLSKRGTVVTGKNAQLAVAIMPYADPHGSVNQSLPLSTRQSRAQTIIPSNILARKNRYYASLMKRYGPFVGIGTNNGTVIGPDGGLIATACKVAATFPNKIRVLEFGSGGGSTALALARENKLALYIGNDFSKEMVEYFDRKVTSQLKDRGIQSSIFFGSCFEMPLRTKVDLISVGVYYQAQPSLFEKRARELVHCLNTSGVLIAQTGMIEDQFITRLLRDTIPNSNDWPWYNEKYSLNRYFRYVAEYIMEQEIILIATNNRNKFYHITKLCTS